MYLQGEMGLNMDKSRPRMAIAAWEWGPYLGKESHQAGIHLMVSSFTRLHPNINLTKSKVTGNYVNSMLVKTLALRSGYDEAVILDPEGFVAECTGENYFGANAWLTHLHILVITAMRSLLSPVI
jgi:branched-chain amino acid aminotransferase